MNVLLLYLLLSKATLLSFSGLASLPIIRADLVAHHQVLTDRQLNTAVALARAGPGPLGLYVVSVGYFVAGVPGALAGALALITPAFLVIPLLRFLAGRAEHPHVKSVIQALTLAGAGLLISATVPLARDAVTGTTPLVIALASFLLLVLSRIDTLWVIIGSAIAGLLVKVFL
jgi:chromate transporter